MGNLPKQLLIGLRLTVFVAALALVYTFVVTGIAQVAFNGNANGSLVTVNGKVVGSTLIGQSCPQEAVAKDGSLKITINTRYFQGRLSYTTNASTASPAALQRGQLRGQQLRGRPTRCCWRTPRQPSPPTPRRASPPPSRSTWSPPTSPASTRTSVRPPPSPR